MKKKIAVIGGGNMGGALIEGLLKSGQYTAADITLGERSAELRDKFAAMGMSVCADNVQAVTGADIVIVAVKPYIVGSVASEVKPVLKKGVLLVSIAAGVDIAALEDFFGSDTPCFRVIPNIAAALCASMSFVSCSSRFEHQSAEVVGLFRAVGGAVLIDEKLLDAAMVSASCGLAYALRYIRASMEAGIEMGLRADMAREVVAQTVRGASELLLNGNVHPEQLIDQVTTPGGITIAGLNEMEHQGLTSSVIKGHIAALNRVKGK